MHFPENAAANAAVPQRKEEEILPPPPEGESVYDTILPESIAYRPTQAMNSLAVLKQAAVTVAKAGNSDNGMNTTGDENNNKKIKSPESTSTKTKTISNIMPLISFLRDGALNKDVGWHRRAERRARGMFPCSTLNSQLEPWEKQLALVEILLLSGGTPHANFRDLAHAWGREKGFHQILASSICTRRGEVDRKRRSDAGGGRNKLNTRSSMRPKKENRTETYFFST